MAEVYQRSSLQDDIDDGRNIKYTLFPNLEDSFSNAKQPPPTQNIHNPGRTRFKSGPNTNNVVLEDRPTFVDDSRINQHSTNEYCKANKPPIKGRSNDKPMENLAPNYQKSKGRKDQKIHAREHFPFKMPKAKRGPKTTDQKKITAVETVVQKKATKEPVKNHVDVPLKTPGTAKQDSAMIPDDGHKAYNTRSLAKALPPPPKSIEPVKPMEKLQPVKLARENAIPHNNDDKDVPSVVPAVNVNDLTMARLLISSEDRCASPVTGGNMGTMKYKELSELPARMDSSPPSSTSTLSMDRMKDFQAEMSNSILKTSGSSAERLNNFEDKLSVVAPTLENTLQDNPMDHRNGQQLPSPIPEEVMTVPGCLVSPKQNILSPDTQFWPIDLSHGHEFLFVTSLMSNQVVVFQKGQFRGILKINESKLFKNPNNIICVDTLEVDPQDPNYHRVVILDSEGFHVFSQLGVYKQTVFKGLGQQFRGLAYHENTKHLVTIDITGAGVKIVSFDLAGNKVTIVVKGTEKLTDKETKCRFLAVHNNLVYITSMLKDRIYVVDLVLKTSWKAAARIKEPTGIAVDPSSGLIYVTSQATKAIEVLDGKGAHLGTLFKDPKQISPLGLAIKNDVLYVANSAQKCITPLKIDFNKFFKTNES